MLRKYQIIPHSSITNVRSKSKLEAVVEEIDMLFQRFGIGTDAAIVIRELVLGFFDMAVEFDDIGVLMRQLAFNMSTKPDMENTNPWPKLI